MEQLFAFKKDSAIFRFYLNEKKELILKIEGQSSIPAAAIFNFLLKKGVKESFIDRKAVMNAAAIAADKAEPKQELRLAIPIAPIPKHHSNILFDEGKNPDELTYVETNEYLGEVQPATGGEKGMDIFGSTIPVPESHDDTTKCFRNIIYNNDEKKLYAARDGFLAWVENKLCILREINIFISEDLMTASMNLCYTEEIPADKLLEALSLKEITYGIDHSAINILALKTKVSKRNGNATLTETVPVAFGKPSEEGKDGYIEWLVDVENDVQFEEDGQGNINFKETNVIKNVQKGKTIAILHNSEEGKPGVGIDGKYINPAPVKDAVLKPGKGVIVSQDGTIFIAEIDGMISYMKDVVSIYPLFQVDQNVDFSTGNIGFEGSVVVDKDILAGFSVDAHTDITVKGTVEGAIVTAGGSIDIKGGIPGQGKANISAGKDLIARYVSETTAAVGNNLIVQNSITDSYIKCYGSIIASSSGIVGGKIFANRGILCKNLGSNMEVFTDISVGESLDKYEQYTIYKEIVDKLQNEIHNIENDLMLLKDDDPQYKMLNEEVLTLKEELATNEQSLNRISGGVDITPPIYKIAVLKVVYAGVKITMQNEVYHFSRPAKGPLLIYYNFGKEKISVRNLSQKEIVSIKKKFTEWLEEKDETIED